MSALPYEVPEFDGKVKEPLRPYCWWSWHPLYPYWSKSCWDAETEEEANRLRESPVCGGLDCYHNKLVHENGKILTVLQDDPVRSPEAWTRIAANQRVGKYATRTGPIAQPKSP